MAKDPVCGMKVDEQEAVAHKRVSEYKGQTYYFCSSMCKLEFDMTAETVVAKLAAAERK